MGKLTREKSIAIRLELTHLGLIPPVKVCRTCGMAKESSAFSLDLKRRDKLRSQCKVCHRQRDQKVKARVFELYGFTCACCRLVFPVEALTIGHVLNDGARDREVLGGGMTFYRKLVRQISEAGLRDDLQTECLMCNGIKWANSGACLCQPGRPWGLRILDQEQVNCGQDLTR